ncbi:endonuclease/exonuclease/phosphatase family protein [soil metagenome]
MNERARRGAGRRRTIRLGPVFVGAVLAIALASAACGGSDPAAQGDRPITVATFNIHHGRGVDERRDLARIARVIRESGADIIGLQEVDRHFDRRSEFQDQLTVLGGLLDMHVAFVRTLQLPPIVPGEPLRQYGNAVLTRYPIARSSEEALPFDAGSEPRGALLATIDAPGGPLHVAVSHLGVTSSAERERQAAALRSALGPSPSRTVVLADVNAEPGSDEARALSRGLTDAWPAVDDGPGLTFPATGPTRRIDHVLVSPDLRVLSARVPPGDAADHLPVVVDVDSVSD